MIHFPGEENCYVPVEDDEDNVLADFDLYSYDGVVYSDWLKQLSVKVGDMTAWLEAGYIPFGDF